MFFLHKEAYFSYITCVLYCMCENVITMDVHKLTKMENVCYIILWIYTHNNTHNKKYEIMLWKLFLKL